MSRLNELLHRQRPRPWQMFWAQPCIFLSRQLYSWHKPIPATPLTSPVAIVCISDTHNAQISVPDGGILIHAGDITQSGSFRELQAAIVWLCAQPHPTKIVIAGNHDLLLDSSWDDPSSQAASQRAQLDWGDIIYLENEEVTISCPNGRQLRIYGSPYSTRHSNWAFQYPRNQDVWAGSVPDRIDVLFTQGPPLAHLDLKTLAVLIYYRLYGEFNQDCMYLDMYMRVQAMTGCCLMDSRMRTSALLLLEGMLEISCFKRANQSRHISGRPWKQNVYS